MNTAPGEINTSRLNMRRLRTDDISKFAAMNADPKVMEFFHGRGLFRRARQYFKRLISILMNEVLGLTQSNLKQTLLA
jgi:hypothetical protein